MSDNWSIPPNLTDHAGQPFDRGKLIVWRPPSEIGRVLSADSNVRLGKLPSFLKPWLIALGLGISMYLALGEVMPRVIQGKGDPKVVRIIGIGIGVLFGFGSLLFTWPEPPRCTYVGSDGAANFTGKKAGTSELSDRQLMRFVDVNVLFSSITHNYKDFIYQGTDFIFSWHKSAGEAGLLTIGGEHSSKDQLPPADNLFHMALRVEELWMEELLKRFGPSLSSGQPVTFSCKKNHSRIQEIRLHSNQIKFVYEDHIESVALADLRRADANHGVLRFDQNDTSWFSSQGKIRIGYGDIGNAKLFVYLLSQLLNSN